MAVASQSYAFAFRGPGKRLLRFDSILRTASILKHYEYDRRGILLVQATRLTGTVPLCEHEIVVIFLRQSKSISSHFIPHQNTNTPWK